MAIIATSETIATAVALLKSHWLIFAITLVAVRLFQAKWLHPLSKLPGPFFGGMTSWYSVYTFFTYRSEEIELDLCKKYGPVIRYQPNLVLVFDPKLLPIVYHKHADKDMLWYGVGGLGMGLNVFTAMRHDVHATLRKRIAGAFSMTTVRSIEHIFDTRIQEFQAKMDVKAAKGERFDFAHWSQFFTYDIISELTFGEKFGFIETEKDFKNLLSAVRIGMPLVGLTQRVEFLNNFLTSNWIADKVMPRSTDKDGIGAVMGYRDMRLETRLKSGPIDGRHDILHHILNSKNADGTTIDVEEAREELLIIMLAASDTTAGAIRSSIYRVLQIPGVYDKLMKELDEAYAAGKISRPVVTYDECIALPYFSAVVKEVLRFDPSAPTHYPRVAPKGGYNLNGFYVPEGTVVGTNSWVISRNKEIYGEDAEEFKPERWLVSEERNKMMENYSFTFGYGARICIGKNVALFEVHKLICQLFLYFKPELVDLEKHGKRKNYGNFLQEGMWVKMHPRTPSA